MAETNPEVQDAEILDVDEDGNRVPARARPVPPGPVTPEVVQPEIVAPLAKVPPLVRPQPTVGQEITVLGQHYDVTSRYATYLNRLDSMLQQTDYLFELDPNAFWKLNAEIDHLAYEIFGQLYPKETLARADPPVVQRYKSIASDESDWGETIHAKEQFLSALIKEAGLGTKDKAPVLRAVPSAAMRIKIREILEPWQMEVEDAGILQVAQRLVDAIHHRRLVILIVDVDPYSGLAFGGGKSQLLYQLLYWVNDLLDETYDARKDCVYRQDRKRFKRLILDPDVVIIGLDEANQFFDQWEWQNPQNKWLVHQIEMYRKIGTRGSIPILGACGSIWNLNKRFRELIVTDRLMVTKWDDDAFKGEATLYHKWGPPAAQEEKENRWGKEELEISYDGLTKEQFSYYSEVVDKAREQNDELDPWCKSHPKWLAEYAGQDEIRQRIDQVVNSPDSAES